ncbi:MAG: enoyl-CoA hydratase-related protein [Bacillota bacterium]|uniref:Enoyl-CoA hydratase/isomerase family protein n=1 Tax=Virgibacillus salarius TaxID=447199 RepID=A0A941I9X9_9BACI|nr:MULTISPECIES: enoyl-CoA hydratase-related protein [Bacillaceae]NAZ08749.1 enoyl-CoA hydratase [Agaribacter marinus]MBR7796038.1 enoyl-CoA hydratase/isomerase family protein [Virgibacillus salarius]MCC2252035.1 enoyl-CoA hydratase/isomerase family protein [Virgibacillus sp. AGTR]MDY7045265.1 enoyl-CoA hydratase-related protein [Virgibacillus sp. M23]QRZ18261.1 enoyl-CoA hydratase/isomerase family protein [Virgibacillus sp. AGTR]
MEFKYIKITYNSNIAVVELNNPPANALSTTTIGELRSAFKQLADAENVHAVILTGSGKFFAAGADIKEFVPAMGDYDRGIQMSELGQQLCNDIEQLKKPVIAAINGPALGGGLELAMGCHFRIAVNEAKLGLPEVKLGLIPSFGGTQRLARITNMATALDLILSGKHIASQEAVKHGLIQVTVSAEELMSTALTIANSFTEGNSMASVTRAIQSIVKGIHEPFEEGLKREKQKFAELFLTEDAKEGVQAFVEKRKPSFHHK